MNPFRSVICWFRAQRLRRLHKQATEWWVRIRFSSVGEVERLWPRFEIWLKTSPRHREMFMEVENKQREVMQRFGGPVQSELIIMSPEELFRFMAGKRESRIG